MEREPRPAFFTIAGPPPGRRDADRGLRPSRPYEHSPSKPDECSKGGIGTKAQTESARCRGDEIANPEQRAASDENVAMAGISVNISCGSASVNPAQAIAASTVCSRVFWL